MARHRLSDLTNLTRAKEAAREWAERKVVTEERKLPVARRLKSLDNFWWSSSYVAQNEAAAGGRQQFKTIETLVPILREQALAPLGVKMSENHLAAHDSLRRQLAAVNCIAPIVDSIRKMRVEGLTDKEIAGLFRHAADELHEATMTKDGELDPAD